jgi:hypothetical protein
MKRIVGAVLASLSLAAIAGEAEAQLVGVEFGVRGGVSVASASFDLDTFDAENRTGFVGGPFLNLDFGMFGAQVAGADVKFSLGVASLWVDGRYNFGLSDVNDAGVALGEIGDFQNRAWNFTVGIGFGL